ncbi:MAG: endonuclease domain-containing protein [Sphingomonadales bacterium]|nr:MAG: endonuclease domain-containing protein [Sphingomonadales bacterium]
MQRIPPELKAAARALRSGSTDAERRLWEYLRTVRPRFTRQLVVSHFILDFACRSLRIAIEIDGGQHYRQIEADALRTAYLVEDGWQVLRFSNYDVLSNVDGVMKEILAAVSRASTHPQPLPFREGS